MKKKITAIIMAVLLSGITVTTIATSKDLGTASAEIAQIYPIPRPRYPEVSVVYGVGVDRDTLETEPVVFLRIKYATNPPVEILPGDVDGDCDVDGDDLSLFQASYGKSEGEPGYNSKADFDSNGKVDHKDLLILAGNYGKSCTTTTVKYETKYYLIIDGEFYTMTEIYERYDWDTGTKIYKYEAGDGSIMTVVIQHFHSKGTIGISADFKDYIITFEPIYNYPRPAVPVTGPMEKEAVVSRAVPATGVGIGAVKHLPKEISKEIGIDIGEILKTPTESIAEWIE